ncbi:ABC transporter substrate-binding protein [Rhizobium hidalgonense]|nr:ABC transporter substrate-binding protein [Rhizobium hidalgonense]
MPTQMSEGWNAVVGDFFNSRNMSPQEVQKRLHDLLMRSTSD